MEGKAARAVLDKADLEMCCKCQVCTNIEVLLSI